MLTLLLTCIQNWVQLKDLVSFALDVKINKNAIQHKDKDMKTDSSCLFDRIKILADNPRAAWYYVFGQMNEHCGNEVYATMRVLIFGIKYNVKRRITKNLY